MTFTNVFLGIAIFLNSISFISSSKACKNQSSVEKSDIMVLNYNEDLFDLYESSPKYFLDSLIYESRVKGILNKNFEKSFDEFYDQINTKISFWKEK